MAIKDLEIRPKDFPGTYSGSLITTIPVGFDDLDRFMGPIYPEADGKYSSTVPVKYKGMFFSIYALYKSPRIGSVDIPGNFSLTHNEGVEELASELAKVLSKYLNGRDE